MRLHEAAPKLMVQERTRERMKISSYWLVPELTRAELALGQLHYYSATLSPAERNYDIYERELLAVMKSLAHWQHYLGWTKFLFIILTDHANLQYWKAPKNLNRRTA